MRPAPTLAAKDATRRWYTAGSARLQTSRRRTRRSAPATTCKEIVYDHAAASSIRQTRIVAHT
jgi:hypothetical protein